MSWLGKIARYFVPFVLVVGGISLFISGMGLGYTAMQSNHWQTVSGIITASAVRTERVKGGYSYIPTVTYKYEWGGRSFEGHAISISDGGENTERVANIIIGPLLVNRSVVVYVDPDDPSRAVSKPGFNFAVPFALIGGIVAILVGGLVVPWIIRHKRGTQIVY